ncbi:MAG: hypothetical protein LUI10_09395 [Lachnospiraceae bacterium]|nr:hypothetical protein [Lachnospiraceae bacterium]
MQVDDLIYLIYVMFTLKELTLGSMLFAAGCILTVVAFLAAFFMTVTGRHSKKKMERKMKERY